MKRSILVITTLLGISLVAHVAIAQLRPPMTQTTNPWGAKAAKKKKFNCKAKACLQSTPNGDIVHVRGNKKTFIVVSRFDQYVMNAQIVSGPKAAVAFAESGAQGAQFDVFELKALGTVDIEGFKPCNPGPNDPSNPDCIPPDFPPGMTQWFSSFFREMMNQ